mgnify:CR=1 FL=1
MNKFTKVAVGAAVSAVFLGAFWFLYQKSQPEVIVYETHQPKVMDLEKTTLITGKIEPRDEVNIKPQISGIIAELYKEAGQMVKKDEVIAKVKGIPDMSSLSSAESRIELAQINLNQAQTDFDRIKNLYEQKLVSTEEYENDVNPAVEETFKEASGEIAGSGWEIQADILQENIYSGLNLMLLQYYVEE